MAAAVGIAYGKSINAAAISSGNQRYVIKRGGVS